MVQESSEESLEEDIQNNNTEDLDEQAEREFIEETQEWELRNHQSSDSEDGEEEGGVEDGAVGGAAEVEVQAPAPTIVGEAQGVGFLRLILHDCIL